MAQQRPPMQTMYATLAATAHAHLHSLRPLTEGSNDPSPAAIRAHLHPSSTTDFGHTFFVSASPHLQGSKTRDEFVAHLCGMAARLRTYTLEVVDTCVDVETRTVVLRVEFHMVPKAAEEVVNDVVFWLVLDESGERVVRCTEFVDAAAATELGRRMGVGE